MSKKISYADITNPNQNLQLQKPLNKQFRPSKFLNDLDSVPANFFQEKECSDIYVDYLYPQTARRRIAIGNDKQITKSECHLPSLQNSSIHKNHFSSPKNTKEDLRKSEILRTDEQQNTDIEIISRKIKKIINSNKRQVTFQSSLIVIDEQNQITKIQDPQLFNDQSKRRKTTFRQKTLAA
ncbi:unnamed protein product (macronuclear) [Paramecium tetraurelia]|uniref:Uncharacterized protein n=1 Tax=Paramecium tetraurelia TaxID=5888 RepID=A0BUN3_PARTE|nr:uncharacterized protein GSPATT00005496001 [Paramecium tetraurelia]CAK62250.1 unnamed protein product [Paramecium tetraurelia]|eukprot:XP_001429648.1 hypothetical protein (macronuclear) [Paramecium tetraurelia strain d4-2]